MQGENLIPFKNHAPDYETLQEYWDSEQNNIKNIPNSEPTKPTKVQNWEYEPIQSALLPVQAFNSEILPDAFRGFVDDASQRMQAPPDYIAVGLMVGLSSMVGRKVAIHPKQQDSWLITPNLWGAVVGRPSSMKSPTLTEALKPVSRLEVDAEKEYSRLQAEYLTDSEVQKMLKKSATDKANKAVKEGNTEQARKLINDAQKQAPQEPVRRRYKVNDSTVEKLGELLNQNPNGLLVFRDEVTGLLKNLDKEEKSADRAFYLEAWNGNQGFTYDRIGRGTIDIEAVTLSIVGGIQPAMIKQYISKAINGGAGDDGLLQRFQLLVYPDPITNWKYVDKQPNRQAIDKAYKVFDSVDKINPSEQVKVRFTDDAQAIFIQWITELEEKLRGGELHPAIESHLAKYRSLIPSLALIIHIADHPEKFAENVGIKSLLKACEWGDYLESHAMRLYGLGTHADNDNALLIAKRFNKLGDSFTRRDIQQKGWTGLKDIKTIQNALDVLVSHNYLKEKQEIATTGRPPATVYIINPAVRI